ncbi:TRAP-type mannitol/chloroaromatic compound transport system, small permease component [Hahella chejuensis KCTC 2396]|uniref:TRAP transporter small permease protein n=1 Tax=Hahella chejuensis (strain KCTC 2396) TaxID=349521 RepID=Q2SEE3_HAHCH|nr:TRAP transporter small permease subunit [Hahella chejuensis]ABC30981.1 TRAP-type mannitol/chloroaromatic compound transport system, small permease component [Hahella chejuensis KCTC 2396]
MQAHPIKAESANTDALSGALPSQSELLRHERGLNASPPDFSPSSFERKDAFSNLSAEATPPPELPHTRLSRLLDTFIRHIGEASAWIWPILMLVIMTNVVMRYFFGEGRIEFEELQWHLYAIGFLTALSYCYQSDDHVRVDVVHERLSLKSRCWIEFFGILFLLIPFLALLTYYAFPFVYGAWLSGERSLSPGGLPYRWAIKAALPVGLLLLSIATASRFSRVFVYLFLKPR